MSGSARIVIKGYSERVIWNRHHPGKLALNELRVIDLANFESGTVNLTNATIIGLGAVFTGIDAEQLPQEISYTSSIGNLNISSTYSELDMTPVGAYLATRAGRLYRIVVQYSEPITLGTITIQPTINGTPVGTPATLDSTTQRLIMDYTDLELDIDTNDLVGIVIETDADFDPVSAQTHLTVTNYLSLVPIVV